MKRQFIFSISSQLEGELQFDDLVNLCLLRVLEVKLSTGKELHKDESLYKALEKMDALSFEEIQTYKKEISEKIKINTLQDKSIQCLVEMDI